MPRMYAISGGNTIASGTTIFPIYIRPSFAGSDGAGSLEPLLTGLWLDFQSYSTTGGGTPKALTAELVKETVAPTGGGAFYVYGIPFRSDATDGGAYGLLNGQFSCNNTTEGTGTNTVLKAWVIKPGGSVMWQCPRGREIPIDPAQYPDVLVLRLTYPSGGPTLAFDYTLFLEV